ncbi:TrmB family transcriptional regulator [Paenibacillus sp. N1-5-1-14]|uniref:TrmB family transcriptional regulator n=1 Tax=Paenibacillus radicibacter TaxID=2972488 RepID=UPI0021594917|nr:helix-turn-helix domain-containing protein [Paenibacillus radicibacter]MCR8642801.1 TrmB family transcriptional regulator [Paenibacillus radicibacter]
MLQKFGFSQYESRVYEVLVTSGEPMDATQIVKHSGVPKSKIYEVLTRMIDKGMLMDSVSEKKKLYTALPSAIVIEKLTAEFQDNIKRLKQQTAKRTFADDRVWSLKVDSSIRAQTVELIESAKESILFSAWNDEFVEFLPLLEEQERKGIEVEALVVGHMKTSLKHIKTLIPQDEHGLERYRLLVIDDREVLFAGNEDQKWQAMKTGAQPFVKFFSEFFYHDVALVKITDKYYDLLMNDEEIRAILLKLKY